MSEKKGDRDYSHPRLFEHKELENAVSAGMEIERKKIVNIINHRHFSGEPLRILLKHTSLDEEIFFDVPFQPCLEDRLVLTPDKKKLPDRILGEYRLVYILLPFEQGIIHVPVEGMEVKGNSISVLLPASGYLFTDRKNKRYQAQGVNADLWQHGFQAVGTLIDFTSVSFRLNLHAIPPSSFHWFNMASPSQIRLYDDNNVLYSGSCRSLYEKHDGQYREIVFAPADNTIQRFTPKPLRNPRRTGLSILQAVFDHPFTKKTVQHTLQDVSTSGFLIVDQSDELALFPGMIIPRMAISVAGIMDIHCLAQVIHRSTDQDSVRLGVAILDMSLTNYRQLFQVLNGANDTDGALLNRVSLDELWEFFFDTGFIYPKKYKLMDNFRNEFRDIYKRLYAGSPDIASHFTYQKNGRLYGHISMLRGYEKTWLIHHLAARPVGSRPIGIELLKQMIHYLNDVHHLPSANMDYIMAYFQPGNKFPERIFGGFFDYHANPQHCSAYTFAYMTCPDGKNDPGLPDDWYLRESPEADAFDFEQFNRRHSNGLFPAIVKRRHDPSTVSLNEKYAEEGFTRDWKMYILYHMDIPKAFIIDERSDIGLNLSNLLNGMKVFVADEGVDPDIVLRSVDLVRKERAAESLSLMVYPVGYAYGNKISPEMKHYVHWILDMQYGNEFVEYLGRKFRIRL